MASNLQAVREDGPKAKTKGTPNFGQALITLIRTPLMLEVHKLLLARRPPAKVEIEPTVWDGGGDDAEPLVLLPCFVDPYESGGRPGWPQTGVW